MKMTQKLSIIIITKGREKEKEQSRLSLTKTASVELPETENLFSKAHNSLLKTNL